MAKRVRERETRSLFNKKVMLAPCVTPSILYILFVVVAFSSCLVVAFPKKHESVKSSRLLHHSICMLF